MIRSCDLLAEGDSELTFNLAKIRFLWHTHRQRLIDAYPSILRGHIDHPKNDDSLPIYRVQTTCNQPAMEVQYDSQVQAIGKRVRERGLNVSSSTIWKDLARIETRKAKIHPYPSFKRSAITTTAVLQLPNDPSRTHEFLQYTISS